MGAPANIIHIMGKGSLDPVTKAWLAQLTTSFASNPSSGYITALDTMIRGMRTDGDLTKLDRLWIYAQEVQGYARVSIVNPGSTQLTEVNTPTWAANQGYTSNATTSYVRSGFNWSTDAVNALFNSVSLFAYVTTDSAANARNEGGILKTTGTQNYIYMNSRTAGGNAFVLPNRPTNSGLQSAVANSLGMISASKSGTTDTVYKNGSSLATGTTTGNAFQNLEHYLLCANQDGSPMGFSTRRNAMFAIGSGTMSHSNFYSRWQTFATAIGCNV